MNDPIRHLPGISAETIQTSRLRTLLLRAGPAMGPAVVFLHGNCSSSTFWEETMLGLPPQYRALALDQRGYGLSDPAASIDATRGCGDWIDDLAAVADHLQLDRFHLVGHSLGGCVAWGALGAWPERLLSATLIAPGPPCGFGGAHGMRGELNFPDGAGSGAGLVNPEFTKRLKEGDRNNPDSAFSPRTVMNRLYWKPPFHPRREEQLLTAMLQVHVGDGQFPGDTTASPNWPGFAPGRAGPANALSPRYNQHVLDQLLAAPEKPPLLWIHGSDDAIVSDTSMSDVGYQGQRGLRPDWPGKETFPAQPLLSQVRYALDEYEQRGGRVRRSELTDVGHTPYLERPAEVKAALTEQLGF